jgi:adenylate cyclase
LGSSVRFDYSAIGDEVNVASRFEGLTKIYGVSNVIGDQTLALAQPFPALELDMVQVKGRTRPTRIYTLIEPALVGQSELANLMEKHHEFLRAYRQQQWDDAARLLAECRSMRVPALATCYETFHSRIALLSKSALPPDWDGSFTLSEK